MKKIAEHLSRIKTRILLLAVLPLLLMVSSLSMVMFKTSSDELKAQVDSSNLGLASSGANVLFQGLTSAENILASISGINSVQLMQPIALQNAAKSASKAFGNFESVVFFDSQGRLVTIEPSVNALIGKDFSQDDYYKMVAETRKPFIGEPIPSKATGNLVVTVSVPIINGDRFLGVLMGSVNVDGLQKLLFKNKLSGNGYYFAVNKKGQIFVHPDQSVASKLTDASDFPVIKRVLKGEKGNDTAVWEGETQLLGYAPMPETGWGVVTVQFAKDLYAPLEKLKHQVISFSVIAIIIVTAIAVLFAIRLTKPLGKLVAMLKDIAQGDGDLTARLNINSKNEFGELAYWYNVFVGRIQEIMRQVGRAAEEVASTSGQLSSATEQNSSATQQITGAVNELATGSSEQTRVINNTVGVMQQFARSVNGIAEGAREQAQSVSFTSDKINTIAERAKELTNRTQSFSKASTENFNAACNGGDAVKRSIESMNRIKDAVTHSSTRISQLGEQSQQIGEIIRVIDDIAEQTNLLALNAAIEAARAGEHGKGFAVVADEVRKLAERSGKATKEIAVLITGIQRDTSASVEAMQVGTQEVEKGVNVVTEAGDALEEILNIVQKNGTELNEVLNVINEISVSAIEVSDAAQNVAAIAEENTASTEEMAAGSSQMEKSITSIAAVVEQSAASTEELSASLEEVNDTTEEMAASAQDLFKMAIGLKELVNQFRV